MSQGYVVTADNLEYIKTFPSGKFECIYIDPPFNTGRKQTRHTVQSVRSRTGKGNKGFGGAKYINIELGQKSYDDIYANYNEFIKERLVVARDLLNVHGTFYFHIDYREAHYVKVMLDYIYGRDNFLNEIIWAYDYGAKSKKKWPAKHDTILVYVKDRSKYIFNVDAIDRIPYAAPGLAGPEKALKGKLPTDVWFHTIVPTNGKEKTGYPTQKPLGIVERMIKASTNEHGRVMDFFAGSGTTGQACLNLNRQFVLVDSNPSAISTMKARFKSNDVKFVTRKSQWVQTY